jgi:hypothetical protein
MRGSRWCVNQISRVDGLRFACLIAYLSRARGDPQHLTLLVCMPVSPRTRRESDIGHSNIAVGVYHVEIHIAAVESGGILDGRATLLTRVTDTI